MTQRLAWWIALGIVVVTAVATAPAAEACPCCGPCSKYDHMMPPEPGPLADVYVRAQPALLGRARGARLIRLLTGSTWRPQAGSMVGSANLVLVDPRAVAAAQPVGVTTTRTALVRNVIRRPGRVLIAIDGMLYRIGPCRDGRRMTTCLVRTDEAPTADDLVPGGGTFAPPPPPPPPPAAGLSQPAPGGE
ncbi:MAG: hypothetical protein JNK64_20200 [Myxococcales bacterium]|nr:hypothetical protein [Myxococcales bacterium]